MTPTALCSTMNTVYETLKPLSVEELNKAIELAIQTMPMNQLNLYLHQCRYVIAKKESGAWA